MSNFAKANTTAQWFQDDYPGAVLTLNDETMVLVIHTTETTGWPGYDGGATAPNYTGLPPLGGITAGQWRAHFPDERSSRALRNLSGGVETNTLNAVQVELIGTCNPDHATSWGSKRAGRDYVYWPNATDAQLRWLAGLVADMHERHGLRLSHPTFKAYPGSYGANGVRLSFDQWRSFAGICGHQHVPENVHGDPGNINMAKVITFAKEMLAPPPPPVATHTRWAVRETAVCNPAGGKVLRMIPAGYQFQVIDGSGHGADGWVQTSGGNWVLGEDTTRTIFSTFLWNVKAGRSWANAILPELNKMLAAEQPDTVGLLEAYDAPDLRGLVPGYSYVYQALGFEPETAGYVEEHSECVVLVRDGLEVKAREAIEMQTSWKGPVVGAMHDPRIIRRVTVEKNGVACRPIYGHGPFGKDAVAEFDAEMVDQLDGLGELGPVMALADWNQDNATVTAKVGTPAGAKVDGGGIDLAVYKSCVKIKGQNLGPHGSDHDAKIWTFGV